MKTLICLKVPVHHIQIFASHVDVLVFNHNTDPSIVKQWAKTKKVWVDFTELNDLKQINRIKNVEYNLLPILSRNYIENLKLCVKHKQQNDIPGFIGEKTALRYATNLFPLVWISHEEYRRSRVLDEGENKNIVFVGLRTVQELKLYKPFALVTSAPISLALIGRDLSRYQRRPKKMIKDVSLSRLTSSQLDLALSNISFIREHING